MILYFTYNDQPSGVYWSQVTDVVEHLNTLGGSRVRLVALVSGRGFFRTRRAIKAHSASAWVVPMVPTMRRWKHNTRWLAWTCRLLRPAGIIARGPFATWMALRMRDRSLTRRVCFDGRGAYAAEWEEYRIIDDNALIAQLRPLEEEAVNASDFRIAVSEALVAHWRERYGYTGDAHAVIPCTLGSAHVRRAAGDGERQALGYGPQDVVLAYAGSTAGWQSFALLERALSGILDRQPEARMLFLSRADPHIDGLAARYPGRVRALWVEAERVPAVLEACDVGILVREPSLTNRVASPTKFAEYLQAGLPVLISARLGDFSAQVEREHLGQVVTDGPVRVTRPSSEERRRLQHHARTHFTKPAFDPAYRALLHEMTT